MPWTCAWHGRLYRYRTGRLSPPPPLLPLPFPRGFDVGADQGLWKAEATRAAIVPTAASRMTTVTRFSVRAGAGLRIVDSGRCRRSRRRRRGGLTSSGPAPSVPAGTRPAGCRQARVVPVLAGDAWPADRRIFGSVEPAVTYLLAARDQRPVHPHARDGSLRKVSPRARFQDLSRIHQSGIVGSVSQSCHCRVQAGFGHAPAPGASAGRVRAHDSLQVLAVITAAVAIAGTPITSRRGRARSRRAPSRCGGARVRAAPPDARRSHGRA